MVAGVKSHSSTNYGCARYTGFGKTIGTLRTDTSFREKHQEMHHNYRFILEDLEYLNMVSDLPLDPMHLFTLVSSKRCYLVFSVAENVNFQGYFYAHRQ